METSLGPRQCVPDQLLAKADVIRAMHERVQTFQDPQTEFAILFARVESTTLRVHGHTILQEKEAAQILMIVGKGRSKDSF